MTRSTYLVGSLISNSIVSTFLKANVCMDDKNWNGTKAHTKKAIFSRNKSSNWLLCLFARTCSIHLTWTKKLLLWKHLKFDLYTIFCFCFIVVGIAIYLGYEATKRNFTIRRALYFHPPTSNVHVHHIRLHTHANYFSFCQRINVYICRLSYYIYALCHSFVESTVDHVSRSAHTKKKLVYTLESSWNVKYWTKIANEPTSTTTKKSWRYFWQSTLYDAQ